MSIVRWILLGLTLCVLRINGFSLSVTRGYQDSIYTNIQQESTGRLICDDSNVCKCKDGLTYIFDSDSLSGKCVRDYEIIKDRSKGKLLPARRQTCIRVTKNEKVKNMKCNENNLSVKWIWTIDEQMLNLKTLRCLKEDTRTVTRRNGQRKTFKQFSMEQCNKSASKQKWVCPYVGSQDVRNKGTGNLSKWIKPNDTSYFQKCPQNIYSYKGCYRFSDGNRIKLIKAGCDFQHNGTCGLKIKIQAPIGTGYTSCQLDWTKSTYTISGFLWYPFNGTIIAGVQLNATLYPVTLQIKNISFLLSNWKGHLLRLNIKCTDDEGRSESHCALLKVEGTATEEIPVSTAPTTTAPPTSKITSQPRSTMFEYRRINMSSTSGTPSQKLSSTNTSYPDVNSQEEENKDSSIILPIVIAAVALFCLVLALVVIVIVCKRRKRKNDDANQNEEHIYEEPHPVDNGPASPIYMEIDEITRSKSKKSNSSQKRNKSQSCETPTDNPFYHTLEKPDRVENSEIYEELDDVPKPPDPTPKAFEKELDV